MSDFRSPLKAYRAQYPEDPALDETRCRAETTSGSGWHSTRQQCRYKPTTERMFPGDHALPCCGRHAQVYDQELGKHEKLTKKYSDRDKLMARCEALQAKNIECWPVYERPNEVTIKIDVLEKLVANQKTST